MPMVKVLLELSMLFISFSRLKDSSVPAIAAAGSSFVMISRRTCPMETPKLRSVWPVGPILIMQEAKEHMLRADVVMIEKRGLNERPFNHAVKLDPLFSIVVGLIR